jgi:pimeloyl-ACP methyl ester carboxylesterase
MRACQPRSEGYVERDGVKVFYEVFGAGEPTVLLLPTWSIIHSRHWKMQIPYLARHCRVLTFDGRGNGRSDRPTEPEAYAEREFAADALAVMDATQTRRAIVVGFSMGAQRALLLAANRPERVEAAVFVGPNYPGGGAPLPERTVHSWEDELDIDEGWAKYNKHSWLRDYKGFLDFFMSRMFTEPHSTKPIEDAVGWGLDTTGETLVLTYGGLDPDETRELARRVRCPVLVIHGAHDAIGSVARGIALAEDTGGRLVLLEGSGHAPHVRDPVKVNLLLRDFVKPAPPQRWVRGRSRRKRALYISSPIGLGHAQRDVAIANELRKLHPDLEIDWLAQHPVTTVLEASGERIHPASALLANESSHIESESAEHDLHCFQAIRRMDEILLANFMVFHDLVRDEQYDVWIGDEAWELDYYLHENPEQKQAAYVWLTDFVGWLPMPDGGEREAFLTADYNAEMIEHIARYPRVRDRAVFVGNSDDIVPDAFGPELPLIGDWTREHYAFAGYATGFDPSDLADRQALRHELGYRDDERVCIVTVGGSGVGGHLLRRVIEAFPEAKRRVPTLRMVVVTGPRIDPASLPTHDGLEVRAFVPQLYRHLAA